jgi:hypothetical protein
MNLLMDTYFYIHEVITGTPIAGMELPTSQIANGMNS